VSTPSQPHTPAGDQTFVDNDFAAELFWEKNHKVIIGAIVAVIIVAIGVVFWLYKSHNDKLAAEALFAEAKNPESWREVIAKYPRTQPAANAYFLLAEAQREQGNFDESNKTYQTFIDTFPKHSLIGGARLGLAENLAAQGKIKESQESLGLILTDDSSSYASPVAGLIEGQQLLRQGKIAEARKVFLNTAQSDPGSPAGRFAGSMGAQLAVLLPPDVAPVATAPAATPAP